MKGLSTIVPNKRMKKREANLECVCINHFYSFDSGLVGFAYIRQECILFRSQKTAQ